VNVNQEFWFRMFDSHADYALDEGEAVVKIGLLFPNSTLLVDVVRQISEYPDVSFNRGRLWAIGFGNYLVENAGPEHLADRDPVDVYSHIASLIVGDDGVFDGSFNPSQTATPPGKKPKVVRQPMLQRHQKRGDWKAAFVRFLCNLINLGLIDQVNRFSELVHINVRKSIQRTWRCGGDFHRFVSDWGPFLHQLAEAIGRCRITPVDRPHCGNLFKNILLPYARYELNRRPPQTQDLQVEHYTYPPPHGVDPESPGWVDLLPFLKDPAQKEATFTWDGPTRKKVYSILFHQYGIAMSCDSWEHETTKRIKVMIVKPENNTWEARDEARARKKEKEGVLNKFDQTTLKSIISDEAYAELFEATPPTYADKQQE